MITLIAALALAATAPAQEDAYAKSWTSSHWSVLAVEGDAPERVAVLLDRESLRAGSSPNLREVRLLSTVEGTGPGWGIVAAIRVDCDARTFMELGRVAFVEDGRRDAPVVTASMSPIAPDSGLHRALPGICAGNWAGFTAADVPANALHQRLFGS